MRTALMLVCAWIGFAGIPAAAAESEQTLAYLNGRLEIETDLYGEWIVNKNHPVLMLKHLDDAYLRASKSIEVLEGKIGRRNIDKRVLELFENEVRVHNEQIVDWAKNVRDSTGRFKDGVLRGEDFPGIVPNLAAAFAYQNRLSARIRSLRNDFDRVTAHLEKTYPKGVSNELQTAWNALRPFRFSSTKAERKSWVNSGFRKWATKKYPGKTEYSPLNLGEVSGERKLAGRLVKTAERHYRTLTVTKPSVFKIRAIGDHAPPKIWFASASRKFEQMKFESDTSTHPRDLAAGEYCIAVGRNAQNDVGYVFFINMRRLSPKELSSLRVGRVFSGICNEVSRPAVKMRLVITSVTGNRFEGTSSFPAFRATGKVHGTITGRSMTWIEDRATGKIASGTRYTATFDGNTIKGRWRNGRQGATFEIKGDRVAPEDRDNEFRTWTSTAGTTVEARFAGKVGDTVTLQKRDRTKVKLPFDKLSDDDQSFIKLKAR